MRRSGQLWTPEEIRQLRQWVEAGFTHERIAAMLQRTPNGVSICVSRRGFATQNHPNGRVRTVRRRVLNDTRRPWTAAEDAAILASPKGGPNPTLTGRTRGAVKQRAYLLRKRAS